MNPNSEIEFQIARCGHERFLSGLDNVLTWARHAIQDREFRTFLLEGAGIPRKLIDRSRYYFPRSLLFLYYQEPDNVPSELFKDLPGINVDENVYVMFVHDLTRGTEADWLMWAAAQDASERNDPTSIIRGNAQWAAAYEAAQLTPLHLLVTQAQPDGYFFLQEQGGTHNKPTRSVTLHSVLTFYDDLATDHIVALSNYECRIINWDKDVPIAGSWELSEDIDSLPLKWKE